MGQFFGREKIMPFQWSDTVITLPAGSHIPIGGKGYTLFSDLTITVGVSGLGGLDTGSLQAFKIYHIYAVVSSGTVYLVASLSSTAPTGYSIYQWIGKFFTNHNGSTVIGVFGRFDQVIETSWSACTCVIYELASLPSITAQCKRSGDHLHLAGRIGNTTSVSTNQVEMQLPGGLEHNTIVLNTANYYGMLNGSGWIRRYAGVGTDARTDLTMYRGTVTDRIGFSTGSSSSGDGDRLIGTVFGTTSVQVSFNMLVPISGWETNI